MFPQRSIERQVREPKNLSTSEPSKQPVQSFKSTKPHSTPSQTRQVHTPVEAKGRRGTAAPSSSSTGRTKGPSLKTKGLTAALSTMQILQDSAAERRGKPLFATWYEPPQHQSDDEPLDKEIAWVLQWAQTPEGFWSYNNYFRAGIMWYMKEAHENGVFSNKYDAHIRQLVRVMDELRRNGECRVGKKIIRPWSHFLQLTAT